MGDGANEMGDNLPPVDLGTGRTAVAGWASGFHVCVILDDASLKCFGSNDGDSHGSLGQPDTVLSAIGMTGNNYGDHAGEYGDNLPAIDLGSGRTVQQVCSGQVFVCALLDNSAVKCWGYNDKGQLGLSILTWQLALAR